MRASTNSIHLALPRKIIIHQFHRVECKIASIETFRLPTGESGKRREECVWLMKEFQMSFLAVEREK